MRDLMTKRHDMTYVGTHEILPGACQVRKSFVGQKELEDSVRKHGILEPILVRPIDSDRIQQNQDLKCPKYYIVGGERRWRAAKALGVAKIPVRVLYISEEQALHVGLVENVQRNSLSSIEEACGYQAMAEAGATQDAIARIIGKSRSYIANMLRLLTLPSKVQEMVMDGLLSVSQARALIGLDDCEERAKKIVASKHLNKDDDKNSTVRELERQRQKSKNSEDEVGEELSDLNLLEEQLSRVIGMPVSIVVKKNGGTIKIECKDWKLVDALLRKLT